MKKLVDDVREFHEACGIHFPATPVVPDSKEQQLSLRLVIEEFFETICAHYNDPTSSDVILKSKEALSYLLLNCEKKPNLYELADGIIDLMVVLTRMGIAYGLPLEELWDEVQRSNMAKAVDGKVRFRSDGKILKPDGWKPPDIKKVIDNAKANSSLLDGENLYLRGFSPTDEGAP